MKRFEFFRALSAVRSAAGDGENINGTGGDDPLTGTADNDLIKGKSGADTIAGLGGHDTLDGGNDDDVITGGTGNDDIKGKNGDDDLHGGADNDTIEGGNGEDTITGGVGNDVIDGGNQNDVIDGGNDDDTILGGNGNDTIQGGDGADNINGGNNDDVIEGGAGNDTILGGNGNDAIDGGLGDDDVNAGNGDDTITTGEGSDTIDGGEDTDTVVLAGLISNYTIEASGSRIVVTNTTDGSTSTVQNVEFLQFDDQTFEVGGESNPPLLVGGPVSTDEDNPATFTVTAYDFGTGPLTLNFGVVSGPGSLTLLSESTVPNALGGITTYSFEFDPDNQYEDLGTNSGGTPEAAETVTISVTDANFTNLALNLDLTVTGVNDAPVAADDDVTTAEDNATTIAVQDSVDDPDAGDTLTTTAAGPASNGATVLNGDGTVTYTPNANYFGPDAFTYTVRDEAGESTTATVNITVTSVNDPPVAVDDNATTAEDTATIIAVQDNDTDADTVDALITQSVTPPANGSATINLDGTVSYTPNPDFFGEDRFEYTVRDLDGATSTAMVFVTVTPVNDPPVANDDAVTTDEDTPITIAVLANDTDVDIGDTLSVVSASNGADGTTLVNGDNTVTYTPGANFNGADSFTYIMEDSAGVQSSATVNVTVDPVNDAPVPLNAAIILNEADGVFELDLSTQVTDVDGDPLTFTQVGIQRDETLIPITITGNGLIRIDPDLGLDLGDSVSTTLVYLVDDGSGAPNATANGFVPITLNGADDPPPPANLPPVANDVAVTADEADGPFSISLGTLVSDPNAGDVLTITSLRTSATDPELPNFAITFTGGIFSGEGGDLIVETDTLGLLADDGETRIFTLDYTVVDAAGLTDAGVITLNLIGDTPSTNTPPEARDIPGTAGYPQASDSFGIIPGDVIVDDPGTLTFVVDMNDLISDAETPDSGLTVTFGDLILGLGGGDDGGPAATAPFSYDAASKILTITLADIGLSDGEEVLGTLDYSVSDGTDSDAGQIVVNFVDPLDGTPPGPEQTTLDFEGFSADPGAELTITEADGFVFSGAATVYETDEITGGGGRDPGGIVSGQTTDPGDNVLVGTVSTAEVPVLDETGEPVLDERGDPTFETVTDKTFAIRGPGSTIEIGDEGLFFTTFSPDQTFPVPNPVPDAFGSAFDLNGLSLNPVAGDGVVVTLTTYALAVVANGPNDFNPANSDYFTQLVAQDSFTFTVDASTPATVIDFEAATLPGGIANTDPTVFDDLYAVEFTTADGTAMVFDDILLTV